MMQALLNHIWDINVRLFTFRTILPIFEKYTRTHMAVSNTFNNERVA